jgi:hypothetical protein
MRNELRDAIDALRIDVADALILQSMLDELVESTEARGDRVGIARLRVLVRLLSSTMSKVDKKSRALWGLT